jgi:hypothetical protein
MNTLRDSARAFLRAVAPADPGVVVPRDAPRCHASGTAPYRLLVVGGDVVAGYGVASHDLAVGGCLARDVAELTGHGTDVETVFHDFDSDVPVGVRRLTLQRLDAIVVVVSGSDARRGRAALEARLRRSMHQLTAGLTASPIVVIAVAPPLPPGLTGVRTARQARLLGVKAMAAAGAAGAAAVLELPEPAGGPGATPAELYRTWSRSIAQQLAPRLGEPEVLRAPMELVDEAARQAAVDRLGAFDLPWETEFRRIVESARVAYGAKCAALSLVDGTRTLFVARRGLELAELPRDETICSTAISHRCGLIVGNAREDARFRSHAPVRSGSVGFYAAYRIESSDGHPLGVLCVADPEARDLQGHDLGLLRDFALTAQRRIWELTADVSA